MSLKYKTRLHIVDNINKFKHAGILRDYEISKKEWVLDGASVSYGFAFELKGALSHDI